MKIFIITILSLSNLYAASITVAPFEMNLRIEKGYALKAELELACRYEKWVWGDSAEYETFYQAPVKLTVKEVHNGEFKEIRLINSRSLFYEYDEFFRSNEECRASFKVVFYSLKYALGYGVNPKKPVSFQLWKGFYDYEAGDQRYDLRKMEKYLDLATYTFVEKKFSNSHLNIWIKQDGREAATNPWVEKAYLNPETGRPYIPEI